MKKKMCKTYHQECVSDIALSIASGYKKEMIHKLLLRRADCYIELKQLTDAMAAILNASQHATSLNFSQSQMGEFSKSVELIKQNIQCLEYQFGLFSVEVAHELRKLSDVMLKRIISSPRHTDYREWCLETHKIVRKAVQLTELNYGPWEPLVRRLERQARLVGALVADTAAGLSQTDCVHHKLYYNLKI